jgi:hypothetical protein
MLNITSLKEEEANDGRVVHSGCVRVAHSIFLVRLTRICTAKHWQTGAYWELPERSVQDQPTYCIELR